VYGPQRHVLFRASGDCPKALRRLVTRHCDEAGRLTEYGFARFDRLVTAAKEIDPELRIYDDVLSFVTEVRDAAWRAETIAEAFPDGSGSRRFDRLLVKPGSSPSASAVSAPPYTPSPPSAPSKTPSTSRSRSTRSTSATSF
jgi:hypothetical protein